jgi:hypothetical protein
MARDLTYVILNPSGITLSEAKSLRTSSVKNLMESTTYKTEILRLKPQNDIATRSPTGED